MSFNVTVDQLQERLSELLDRAVSQGEECVVQRDGEDYVVIISARKWQRQRSGRAPLRHTVPEASSDEARIQEIGRRLDALGPEYRLSPQKQERMEELLEREKTTSLTPMERRELESLAEECDEIMLRRAQALHRVL